MSDDYIVRTNIRRFEQLLANEPDPARRATLTALLADERRKIAPPSAGGGVTRPPPT